MIILNKNSNYPKVVKLKSQLSIVVVAAMGLVVSIIVYNIVQSIHQIKNKNLQESALVKQVATDTDVKWYQQAQTKKLVPVKTANIQEANKNDLVNPENKTTTVVLEELQKAMAAPITSNQIIGEQVTSNNVSNTSINHSLAYDVINPESPSASLPDSDQNKQVAKKAFLQTQQIKSDSDYLSHTLKNPISRYEIKAGTIIPAILISGINSDLPGQITAQVRSSVYDTATGKYVLIPPGAKLIGVYDSQIVYGQERVLIAWQRIIFPNGKSLNLDGMPGVDISGYAGFNDQVNSHYQKLFGSVLLMSVLGAGAQLSQPQQPSNNNGNGQLSVGQMIAQNVGANVANTGNMLLQKNSNVQPTLEIRPGYEFNITVTKDIVFPSVDEESQPQSESTSQITNHFDDRWATANEVRHTLKQAAQQGKLAYVLNKAQAMNLPASVALVPLVESHYQNITSSKGAVGDWQLMPVVAKDYGITQAEREQFKPATDTALKLLQDLHTKFGNWELAFAAYNAGSMRVANALKAQPAATSIQELPLSAQTKRYVARLKAANGAVMTI